MEVFRLAQSRHGKKLSGKGAALRGSRWNSKGIEIIYTAANRSLAMAEVAVHFSFGTMPDGYMMLTIDIQDHISILEVHLKDLPPEWNTFPPLKETQQIGDQFIRDKTACLLKVPSAVTQGDFNFLINPFHPEFKSIKITGYEPFPFDRRLFKGRR